MPLCHLRLLSHRLEVSLHMVRPLVYLHDVALNGRDALLPLLLVRKVEAEAQRLWLSYL